MHSPSTPDACNDYYLELNDISLEQRRSLHTLLTAILTTSSSTKPNLAKLRDWLGTTLEDEPIAPLEIIAKLGREIVSSHKTGRVTYQLEKIKCGKKGCKCASGALHGPYWYAYRWNGKKVVSEYIGKTLKTAKTEP
ncbi:DUF6788 family protein [Leptolyngbya sp. NIES-2104]|uniref:DUF6788 family protein n=1 Tax=Leptolyngbya sp. NIES-2104 TaxID=1552121 RepID=UPI00073EB63D|nr:DUF6788 family protein [Leptolyngbya sp. NIES-2104]